MEISLNRLASKGKIQLNFYFKMKLVRPINIFENNNNSATINEKALRNTRRFASLFFPVFVISTLMKYGNSPIGLLQQLITLPTSLKHNDLPIFSK